MTPKRYYFTKLVDGKEYKCYRDITVTRKLEYSQLVGVEGLDEKPDSMVYNPSTEIGMQSVAHIIAREIIIRSKKE